MTRPSDPWCDACGTSHFQYVRVRDLPALRNPRLADDRRGVYGIVVGLDQELTVDEQGNKTPTGNHLLKLTQSPRSHLIVTLDDRLGVYLPCKGRRRRKP